MLAAGIAAPSFLSIRSAYAAYPDRPIKIVVANTPGGPSDITARIVTAALQQATGKTFIVENRGGAGGNIGMGYTAKSEPDGYTVILITNAFSANVSLYHELPYKTSRLRAGLRTGKFAEYVYGESRSAGEDDEGIRRVGPRQPRQIQLRDAADRHLVAIAAGIPQVH